MTDTHRIEGIAAPLDIANLDTDQIMPKQFLRGIDKAGLDKGVLWDLRFDGEGRPRVDFVLNRLTFVGAWYISAVCVLPTFLQTKFNVPFYYGGTSLLIVVGVALDTAQQIESHLLTRNYDGFMKRGKLRGRR